MEQYLKEHMLTPEVTKKYDLKVSTNKIEIPIKDAQGNYLFSKYRMFNNPGMKYQYDKGSEMALFNADKITDKTLEVWIVEGEFDAIALSESFAPFHQDYKIAVSSTGGAGSWNENWNELLFGKKVQILLDADKAGIAGSIKLWEKIPDATINTIGWQGFEYKDVCEMIFNSNGNTRISEILAEQYSFNKLTTIKSIDNLINIIENDSPTDFSNRLREKLSEIRQEKKWANKKKKQGDAVDVDGTDIIKLKEILITDFVYFTRGVAKCIFHEDSTPSMHYNNFVSRFKNTVKCYSCGKFADVIDVVMELNGVDFKEALEILRKHNGTNR